MIEDNLHLCEMGGNLEVIHTIEEDDDDYKVRFTLEPNEKCNLPYPIEILLEGNSIDANNYVYGLIRLCVIITVLCLISISEIML
jgi:hypothetical protein